MIFFHIIVVSVRKSDVREKILPANEEIRIKTNHKPKVNAKGKENNAVFFFFWETWPSLLQNENKIPMCRTSHVLENMSNSAANHSSFNPVTKSLGKIN